MTDIAVIMQTDVDTYGFVLSFLECEGFNPVAYTNPVKGIRYFPGCQNYVRSRPTIFIAVPHDEKADAELHLKNWSIETSQEFDGIARNVRNKAIGALVLLVAIASVSYLISKDFDIAVKTTSSVCGFVLLIAYTKSILSAKNNS